ncbi:hypothetical protein Prudu_021541, partial [Prunus dulcis]
RRPGHHRPSRSPPWYLRVRLVSPSRPDRPPPRAALSWPENHVFRRRFLRSHPKLPAQNSPSFLHQIDRVSSRSPTGPQKRTSRGHRSAPDPPPGQSKLPRHPVENIGFGQNTGETLPNFRQKSKGEFKARRATARPPQAEPISAVGTYGSASVSPSRPDRPPPRGRPELAGKPCFPTEVPSKPPELPAQNSPSFLHQIDRVRQQEPTGPQKRTSRGHRSAPDPPPGQSKLPRHPVRGDSAEFSAEV